MSLHRARPACVNETAERMGGITGIEFGPSSCVLVRARRRDDAIELSAGHVIEPHRWPRQAAAATELLKGIRREHKFPRVARVVAWGLAEGAGPRDPATRAALAPLIAAGFRIESVFSPAHALALLAATRPRGNAAVVWMAINRHSAAIAIVRGGELLYSRAFGWNWEGAAIGSQAQLLQRYSIVAHLAPEVRRGMDLVRSKFGVPVEAAVTCGDLPDLRSLTMPLIEELDVEVETLDSAEGLMIPPLARRDHLPDSLAAVRLACAAAAGPVTKGISVNVAGLARAAAVVAAVGSLAWIGYVWWARPEVAASTIGRTATAAPPVAKASSAQPPVPPARTSHPAPRQQTPPRAEAAEVRTPQTTTPSLAGSEQTRNEAERAAQPSAVQPQPNAQTSRAPQPPPAPSGVERPAPSGVEGPRSTAAAQPQPSSAEPRVDIPRSLSGRPQGTRADRPRATASAPATTDISPAPRRMQPAPSPPVSSRVVEQPAPVPSSPPAVDVPAPRGARPAPLKDPLPVIETILVSSDRRMAVIDGGAIVSAGDPIGQRTVARIEVDAIFLREPSGLEIRVPIRVRR